MHIRAAVALRPNAPLSLEDLTLDGPGPGEVLIRMAAAGLCHTDLGFMDGTRDWSDWPIVTGHEGSGVVLDCGPGVTTLKPGDHVVVAALPECGVCPSCRNPKTNICDHYNDGTVPKHFRLGGKPIAAFCDLGTFADHAVVREIQLTKIRADAPLDAVCCVSCAGATGVGAAIHTAQMEKGSSAVVFGLGGIGLNVVAGARIAGARMIIGVDTNEAKRATALRAGVTHFVNPLDVDGDLVGYLTELTGGGADYAFECAGNEAVLNQAIACTHRGWGTVVMIGILPGAGLMHIPQRSILAGRTLKGSLLGNVKMRSQLPQLVDWFMEGNLPLDRLISHRIKHDQINDGFDLMVAGKSVRTIIEYD